VARAGWEVGQAGIFLFFWISAEPTPGSPSTMARVVLSSLQGSGAGKMPGRALPCSCTIATCFQSGTC
jgi:hypothetical protein